MNIYCQILGHRWTEIQETKFTWCAKCDRCNKWSYHMDMRENNTFVPSLLNRAKNKIRAMNFSIRRIYRKFFPEKLPF